jgi:hypothetical protein
MQESRGLLSRSSPGENPLKVSLVKPSPGIYRPLPAILAVLEAPLLGRESAWHATQTVLFFLIS